MEMGTLVIDIDGTICTQNGTNYNTAHPKQSVIDKINKKYDEGYTIILHTARGTKTDIDWSETTKKQLSDWGIKYHQLLFKKPAGDLYIDDKAVNVNDWEQTVGAKCVLDKPWGKEYLLELNDNYAFKRLEINPGKCISKQYHEKKHETWHVVAGAGLAKINGIPQWITPGDTIILLPKMVHQVKADGPYKLVIIEASTPEIWDVVRLQRSFG